jgi:hypothetical protein
LALHFRNLRGQTLLRDIPDIRFVFSVTEKRPAAGLCFVVHDERLSYRPIWPIYCQHIGAAATALRQRRWHRGAVALGPACEGALGARLTHER